MALTENVIGPSVGGVLPGNVRTTNEGLLSGIENVLQLDLSVPATQPSPISYYAFQQPQSAPPVGRLTQTHISRDNGRPERGGLFAGTGVIAGPRNGIIPGPVTRDGLLGIDALVATNVLSGADNILRPAESGVIPESVGSTDSGVLSGIANSVGHIVCGILPGDNGPESDSLLLGNGNILELDLSLPATQMNPILNNYIQHYQSVL